MRSTLFFEQLQRQWEGQLPFVAYRKPESTTVCALLQQDDALYTTVDYVEKGFVFAPFDSESEAILIPYTHPIQTEYDIGKGSSSKSDTRNQNYGVHAAKRKHIGMVQRALERLQDGVLRKVVLSRKEILELGDAAPLAIFKKLLDRYATAMVYCWYHPKVGLWLGATPETLLRIDGDRFYTMALAGTQTYEEKTKTVWGNKEREEQAMVIEELCHGLTAFGIALERSETYTHRAGNLVHLRTDIQGMLQENLLKELIEIVHPTPAVCGLPKQEAKAFISKYEGYNRAFYTGFLGEMNFGDMTTHYTTLFVNLRCMQLRGNQAHLYVGGGITKASVPEKEWEETVGKTSTIRVVL